MALPRKLDRMKSTIASPCRMVGSRSAFIICTLAQAPSAITRTAMHKVRHAANVLMRPPSTGTTLKDPQAAYAISRGRGLFQRNAQRAGGERKPHDDFPAA